MNDRSDIYIVYGSEKMQKNKSKYMPYLLVSKEHAIQYGKRLQKIWRAMTKEEDPEETGEDAQNLLVLNIGNWETVVQLRKLIEKTAVLEGLFNSVYMYIVYI